MKLRLANPEHLIDINGLTDLAYIREGGGEIRIGALTRHVELLKSDLLAEHFPLFRDAEQVIADPVVRNRGTIGGSLCQADPAEDLSAVCAAAKATRRHPRRRRRARGRDGGLPRRPVHDRGRRGGDPHRSAPAVAPRRRQRAREGRAPRRRLGDRCGVGRRVARRRHHRRRRHRAQRGRPHDDPPRARRAAAARPGAFRGAVRAGRARSRRRIARPAPTAAGRSTTSGTSPASSPAAPCAVRPRAPCARRPDRERLDDGQRRARLARRRAAPAARALHPRDRRPDRNALGLRHVELRRLRRADRRRAGQVVHDPGRDGRGPRDPHGRVARGRRPARPDPAWDSTSGMRSSAGSARRGCS